MNKENNKENPASESTKDTIEKLYKKGKLRNCVIAIIGVLLVISGIVIFILYENDVFCKEERFTAEKPVIYLYPTEKTDVSVNLKLYGKLTCTYPEINKGWNVIAYPNGKVINKFDGKEYSYLYWEGESNTNYDMSKGFVVKGEDTAKFLQEKLSYMGLTPREYNEFIVYWLPQMQNNKYNLITFQGKAYKDSAKLEISPKPDSILRVFMAYKPLKKPIDIKEQKLEIFERKGFTVVEWGGCEIKKSKGTP